MEPRDLFPLQLRITMLLRHSNGFVNRCGLRASSNNRCHKLESVQWVEQFVSSPHMPRRRHQEHGSLEHSIQLLGASTVENKNHHGALRPLCTRSTTLTWTHIDEYHSVCWFSSFSLSSNPGNEDGEGLPKLPPLGSSSAKWPSEGWISLFTIDDVSQSLLLCLAAPRRNALASSEATMALKSIAVIFIDEVRRQRPTALPPSSKPLSSLAFLFLPPRLSRSPSTTKRMNLPP